MVTPLTPEEIDSAEFDDLGLIDVPDVPDPDAPPSAPRSPFLGEGRAGAPPPVSGEVPVPDEPPAHARKRKRAPKVESDSTSGKQAKRPRVLAGVRADINAKVSVPLEVGGTIWAARDPLCGVAFLNQRPAIADALTDIICDSPDLVAWFTGPASRFMLYLNLAGALFPVVEMISAHHVYHSVEVPVMDHREMPAPETRAA